MMPNAMRNAQGDPVRIMLFKEWAKAQSVEGGKECMADKEMFEKKICRPYSAKKECVDCYRKYLKGRGVKV